MTQWKLIEIRGQKYEYDDYSNLVLNLIGWKKG
jgi:hypothetical protein